MWLYSCTRDTVSRVHSDATCIASHCSMRTFWAVLPQILCKHFVTCQLFRSHDRRCSYAVLHHVVAAGCARDLILTFVCHIPDGRTVFSFQGASENVPLLYMGNIFVLLGGNFWKYIFHGTWCPALPPTVHWVIFLRIVRCFEEYIFLTIWLLSS